MNIAVVYGIKIPLKFQELNRIAMNAGIPIADIQFLKDNIIELAGEIEKYNEDDFFFYSSDMTIFKEESARPNTAKAMLILGKVLSVQDVFHGDEEVFEIDEGEIDEAKETVAELANKYNVNVTEARIFMVIN